MDMILVEVGGGLRRGFAVEGIGLGEEGLHRGLQGVDIDLEGDIQIDCTEVVVVEDIPLDREEDIVLHREQVVGRHMVDILVVEVLRTVPEVVLEGEDILLEDPGNTTLEYGDVRTEENDGELIGLTEQFNMLKVGLYQVL